MTSAFRSAVAPLLAMLALLACAWPLEPQAQTMPAAQETPAVLTGTLQKVRATGVVTLGHRAASVPFSYLSPRGEPIGYSIDLCRLLVDRIAEHVGRAVAIRWQPVTPETRLDAVASGQVDLECGSTTSNLERQRRVAFSSTIFVSGTKLLVRRGAPIESFRDLGGKRVVVTRGTTNEEAVRALAARFRLDIAIAVAPDHAASLGVLTRGDADAFATDDVLLYGLVAQNDLRRDYVVTGDFLSYDPYGIVFRKDDAQFAALVGETLRHLADDRELERRYERWFLQKLPSGISLDLPMSPQLEAIFQTLLTRTE